MAWLLCQFNEILQKLSKLAFCFYSLHSREITLKWEFDHQFSVQKAAMIPVSLRMKASLSSGLQGPLPSNALMTLSALNTPTFSLFLGHSGQPATSGMVLCFPPVWNALLPHFLQDFAQMPSSQWGLLGSLYWKLQTSFPFPAFTP